MKNPLVKKPETNSQNSSNSQKKYPETLEEQRDYYLNLYEKWAKWQNNEKLKVKNLKLWKLLQKIDFEKEMEFINIHNNLNLKTSIKEFIKIAKKDKEIKEILLILPTGEYFPISQIFLDKKIVLVLKYNEFELNILRKENKEGVKFSSKSIIFFTFTRVRGLINFKNLNNIPFIFNFISCNFSHITLENFDLRHFSVETMEYLQEMKKENKLTLINCKEWELPILRENLEMEEIGKKVWEKKIILDEKNKPLRTLLHKHLAFFSDFVELTEGKKVQIRITSETQIILVEIFSFNGATSELIERKYYEFIDYSLNDQKDTSKINFSEKIDIITRIKNESMIGFAKGMFIGEKNHLEDLQKDKFEWQQLAKDLIKKLPDYKPNQQISITNSMSSYNLNNSANNNSGNLNLGENNQIIDNKITEILANNPDLELRKVLFEIKELKNQIIQNPQIEESDKEDSLEAVNEIVHNVEKKDKPENQKIIRNAFKKLSPITGNLSLGIITNLAWEMLKLYFGLKF